MKNLLADDGAVSKLVRIACNHVLIFAADPLTTVCISIRFVFVFFCSLPCFHTQLMINRLQQELKAHDKENGVKKKMVMKVGWKEKK